MEFGHFVTFWADFVIFRKVDVILKIVLATRLHPFCLRSTHAVELLSFNRYDHVQLNNQVYGKWTMDLIISLA